MNITGFIDLAKRAPELRFLVIGSYAMAAHGSQYARFHIDFLALKEDRDAWITKALGAGLRKVSETSVFAEFSQKDAEDFGLMFVDRESFEQTWRDSFEHRFDEYVARAPQLDQLVALELHIPEHSESPNVSMEVMIQRNADFRRWFPNSIPTEEERVASKVHAEFVL